MHKSIFLIYFFILSLFASSQTVDFSFQSVNGLFCNPATIQFTQNCTGNPTDFIWNLGNGLETSLTNPSTGYTNAGTYTVKLIAIYPQGALEISKKITISPTIRPKIGFDRNYICQPGAINFSVASNGNVKNYDWEFGDATGIISVQTNTITHSFSAYGSDTVILKATDAGGCFGIDTAIIDVKKIPISAIADPSSGCIPATVGFTSIDTIPVNDAVSSYVWDFGDGTPVSTTISGATNHTFAKTGSYLPKLTITTNEGCTNTFNFERLAYGIPPANTIAYAKKTTVCGSESPVFVAKATNANSYLWEFDDGDSTIVTDTITNHKYATLGIKSLRVTPYFNGCAGPAKSFQIEVIGVIAKFTYNLVDCADKKTFRFNNRSEGILSSILWDFGDGTPTSATANTVHGFPAAGEFITNLTVTDSITGCLDTISETIYTAAPTLINNDTSICKNSNITFTISGDYSNPTAKYVWNLMGNKTIINSNPVRTATAGLLGSFDNYVIIVNGPRYCSDTISVDHPILVRGPELNFTMPANICFGDFVNITNNSRPFLPADSVALWYWNYGNSLPNDTTYQPAPIQYTIPTAFNVELTAVDINGCKDSLINTVLVSPLPFLQIIPDIDTLCSGKSDTIYAFHSDSISWSPSNGLSCTNCDTVIAKPSATTQYFITATTPFACSIRDSILVKVIQPFTAVPPIRDQYVCLNDQVVLDMEPKNKVIVWSPGTGLSNTHVYNPIAKPTQVTIYTATLTDSTGCFTSSADITVFFKAVPTVDAGLDRVVQYNGPFTISPLYSSNISSYLWSPSSFLSCTNCPSPSGIATNSQTYTITVTSDSGCIASDLITINIECKDANILMPKAFTPNNDNLNDYYYPITRGIKTILQFSIYNREGKILYQAKNFSPNNKIYAWNGDFKGKRQSMAAYVFVVEALCELGEKLTKSGSFLLLK